MTDLELRWDRFLWRCYARWDGCLGYYYAVWHGRSWTEAGGWFTLGLALGTMLGVAFATGPADGREVLR